jgi:hypothetical protein
MNNVHGISEITTEPLFGWAGVAAGPARLSRQQQNLSM